MAKDMDPDYEPVSDRRAKKNEKKKLEGLLKNKDKRLEELDARCKQNEEQMEKMRASLKKRKEAVKMLKKRVAAMSRAQLELHRDLEYTEKYVNKLREIIPRLEKKIEELSTVAEDGLHYKSCERCKKSLPGDQNPSELTRRKCLERGKMISVCMACRFYIDSVRKGIKKDKRTERWNKKKEANLKHHAAKELS